ncbi:ATP-binding protein [Ktedonobacter robiniae]|uniref:ATP-binding protein n=1 Tax=Ktedonobacter robiniae TaxID=2778365 RepID=A0ABQ3UTW1_9CHLR|nr:ATP-binding protein [Ktedonobacter robiniae]GHO56241.1 ATP-binding protein [Ktedonobacter robiniae]
MAKLSAEARAQLDTFKAVTVKHTHLQAVDDQLSLWVEEHTDATHVLLCGPGGVGKSKALKVVAERFTREEPDRFVVPILLLEPIPPDLGPYLRLDYYWQIIDALKEHLLVKELVGNVAHLMAAPKATRSKLGAIDWLKMRAVAEQALIRARVKAVFVDEGHRLMQGDGSHTVDEQLEWLKSLSNRTNVLHVLAGPYALFGFRNTSGQLARRGRDIHFQRYHVNSSEERKAFAGAVQYLLERVPLTCDIDAFLKRWRWFAEGSVGCVGILRDWLVDAVTATLAQGGTSLTEEVLIRTMPHPARRVSLEMEARTGEHKVALHDSEGAKQFQALLKKPGKATNAEVIPTQGSRPRPAEASVAEPASVTLPLPQVSPKPTQPRVGQRAPERDPVGRTSVPSARKTSGCSFIEAIPVTLVQIEEVGVSRFECPTCLAVRDIKPKGDRVKFPSHPRRMTNTPNQGSRWVKRGSVWNLFDS